MYVLVLLCSDAKSTTVTAFTKVIAPHERSKWITGLTLAKQQKNTMIKPFPANLLKISEGSWVGAVKGALAFHEIVKKKNHNLRCFVFSTLTTQLLDFFDATNSFRMSTDDSIKFISKSPSVQIVGVTWSRIACRLGCFMSAFFATSDYPTQIDSFDKEKRHPLSTDYWTPNFQEKSAPPPYPLVSCL